MLWINTFRKQWSDRMSDVKDNTARRKYNNEDVNKESLRVDTYTDEYWYFPFIQMRLKLEILNRIERFTKLRLDSSNGKLVRYCYYCV